jgi:hypothetical protein
MGMKNEDIEFLSGKDNLTEYVVPDEKGGRGLRRAFCTTCGSKIWNDWQSSKPYEKMNFVRGVCVSMFGEGQCIGNKGEGTCHFDEGLAPKMHIFYENRVKDINDGLPHFKDLPKDFGGSGEMCE